MDINSDRAYEYIRKRILSGEFRPGQALMAKALAAELGVSPTPVRDALRQLEADGLVTIRARLGASVNRMNLKEFQDLCELRLILETHTAELAAMRRTDSDLHSIKQALEGMKRVTERFKTVADEPSLQVELEHADVQFHLAIMVAARNDLIRKEIMRLHLVNRVVSAVMLPLEIRQEQLSEEKARKDRYRQQVVAEHEQIYLAIEHGDAAAAGGAMKRSLEGMFDFHILAKARAERELMARDLTKRDSTVGL
jgi:DNA-binding GntR family transcriptional regulator